MCALAEYGESKADNKEARNIQEMPEEFKIEERVERNEEHLSETEDL